MLQFLLLIFFNQSKENKEKLPEVEIQNGKLPLPPLSHFHVLPNTTFAEINNFLHNASSSANEYSSAGKTSQQKNPRATSQATEKPSCRPSPQLRGHLAIEPAETPPHATGLGERKKNGSENCLLQRHSRLRHAGNFLISYEARWETESIFLGQTEQSLGNTQAVPVPFASYRRPSQCA